MIEFFAFFVWGVFAFLAGTIVGTGAAWQHVMVDRKLTEWRGKLYLVTEQRDLGEGRDRG